MVYIKEKKEALISKENGLFWKAFLTATIFGVLFYILQFLLASWGWLPTVPNAENIKVWDAGFYYSIGHSGYDVSTFNTGFFPLFAWVWRYSFLGAWGITGLNILFFSFGFAFLMQALKERNRLFWLLCLTIPPVYFAFVPLSEALFFFLAAVFLWSITKKKPLGIFVSLFLLSLTRSVGIFLLPALLVMEIFQRPVPLTGKAFGHSCLRFLYCYALPILLALALIMFLQYQATGDWMIYYKTQSNHWDKGFRIPEFPLGNIENGMQRYGWLNALAIYVDALALFWLVWQFILWLKGKLMEDKMLLISMGYLTMVLVSILFFNPNYGTTRIMGANRYTFVTPFFFVFLHYAFHLKISLKSMGGFLLLTIAFWFLFETYRSPEQFMDIAAPAFLLILAFLLGTWKKKLAWLFIGIIAFDFMMQIHYFQQFIQPLFTD